MRKKVCNLVIVDASGSMGNRVEDVKGNLKALIKDVKNNELVDQHLIVCDFSNDFNVLLNTVDTKNIDKSFIKNYKVRNSTALFDAIKEAFGLVPKGFDGVFVNILTDGEENASKKTNAEEVKRLISSKREENWAITFQGCDEKAIENAKSLGITNISKFTNTSKGYSEAKDLRSFAYSNFTNSLTTSSTALDNLFNNPLTPDDME